MLWSLQEEARLALSLVVELPIKIQASGAQKQMYSTFHFCEKFSPATSIHISSSRENCDRLRGLLCGEAAGSQWQSAVRSNTTWSELSDTRLLAETQQLSREAAKRLYSGMFPFQNTQCSFRGSVCRAYVYWLEGWWFDSWSLSSTCWRVCEEELQIILNGVSFVISADVRGASWWMYGRMETCCQSATIRVFLQNNVCTSNYFWKHSSLTLRREVPQGVIAKMYIMHEVKFWRSIFEWIGVEPNQSQVFYYMRLLQCSECKSCEDT